MRVMIQLRSSPQVRAAAMGTTTMEFAGATAGDLPGFVVDHRFGPVPVPTPIATEPGGNRFSLRDERSFAFEPEEATYIVRGTIPDANASQYVVSLAMSNPDVVGVFSDPVIETTLICPGSPPKGTHVEVAKLLGVQKLAQKGMTGAKVLLAIVDTGVNKSYLVSHGQNTTVDVTRSWTPTGVATTPGSHPVDHGTMCAFDAGIAAPKATLLDYAVLLSTTSGGTAMAGLLSDAVKAYSKLLSILLATPLPQRAMVVSNSWGMFKPSWDYPVGHPGNYSDNPAHPFNVIVSSLEHAGADILFAAGNCGRDCPDGRCGFGTSRPICGANSHPAVLSVAGIDVTKNRVGYSSQGPGRLSYSKPDISAYTHFKGSGVYPADGGTSAACPVAAGVVAAIRSKYPVSRIKPFQLRNLIKKTALDLGGTGFDFNYGWGAIYPEKLMAALIAVIGAAPTVSVPVKVKKNGKANGAMRRPKRRKLARTS